VVTLGGFVAIHAIATQQNRLKLRLEHNPLRVTIFASILHILLLKVLTKLFPVMIVVVLEISLKKIFDRELNSARTARSVVGRQKSILSTTICL